MKNFKIFLFNVMLLLPLVMFAQQTVTGKVTEATGGTALPGVGVIIKGTTIGAATDFDGNYTLENVKPGAILVFSYVGFNTQSVTVGNNTTINIVLTESAESLDEVVIIGYGTTTVKDATGSVAAVTAKDFNKGNIVTPASLIQGRVAGVDIVSDGAPGGGSTIRIRGGSSLGASNDPLIVIDGLPITNSTVNGSTSVLSSINPNDIESFSILKDASATAIYGSRASNGVIIITTKKGKQNFQVDLNIKTGYQTLADKISVFSAADYRNLIVERIAAGQPTIKVEQLGNANTDWQDEIYQEEFTIDNSISLSGAILENLPARLSFGNTQQPGLRKTSKFERTSLALNLNPTFFKESLKVNFNLNASAEKNRFADGVEGDALYFDPTQPVYDTTSPFGGFFEYHTNGEPNNAPRNPVASLMQRKNTSVVDRLFGNVEFDYKFLFLPELRAVVNLGYDRSYGIGSNNLSTESIKGFRPAINTPFLGEMKDYTSERKNTLLDAYSVYNKELENLKIEVTGGYSYQKFEGEDFDSGNTIDPDAVSDVKTLPDIVLLGFFGRTNLSFMDKYLLTLSYRRDGTSRFSEANRWGNFPAAALAWKINEEDFLKDSNTLSTLKLRLGWGITGQQDIGEDASYAYLGRHLTGDAVSQYIFGNTPIVVGIPQSRFEDLKWEETTTYNAGLDFGFVNDRITGSAEVYLKESKDLLAKVAVADGSNFSNAGWQNIGKFTSKGVEFSLGADIVKTTDFNWNVNYNIDFNRTEIDELALGQDLEVGGIAGGTGSRIQVHREGFAPYSYFVFKQLYDTAGKPIEGAYADINQDGIVNLSDRYIYKKPSADITMGFQSSIDYKNFDLSFNLRASIGNYNYNNVNSDRAQYNDLVATTALGNLPVSVLESNFVETSNVLTSDYFIENASFLKMDNLTFGYTFNKFNKDLSSIHLFGGVQNVFTITNYSGLDPEIFGDPRNNNYGIDNTYYPRARTFLMGANIKF